MKQINSGDEKLTRYTLVGVMSGIIAFFINLIFDISFCYITGFSDFSVINISTIIYGSLIPMTLSGICFYYFDKLKAGLLLYIICCAAIAIYLINNVGSSNTYPDPQIQKNFVNLFRGIIAILGFVSIVIIPYLGKNTKATAKFI